MTRKTILLFALVAGASAFPLAASAQSDSVQAWIKNNAGWWADGMIPDDAFVSGLQWLISNGIMKIS